MASSYRNKNSVYMEICNRNDSNKGTKVRGGHLIYKNKYCALCHGFRDYSNIVLGLIGCKSQIIDKGTEVAFLDESCYLQIYNHIKPGDRSSLLPSSNTLNCTRKERNVCLHSYYPPVDHHRKKYQNPYCAKYDQKRYF